MHDIKRIIYVIVQLFVNFMRRGKQCFKIFQMVNDLSENTPEKIFLVQQEFNELKANLSNDISIVGLVGTKQSIVSYIEKLKKKIDSPQNQTVQLQLGSEQKAAIFAIQVSSPTQPDKNILFLSFITSSDFFYVKPYDRMSIIYLLIRYIGDLCSDIILLYDEKMGKQFQSSGCPYAVTENQIQQIRMVRRSLSDIQIKEVLCDFRALFKYDQKFGKCLNLKGTMINGHIQYNKKMVGVEAKQIWNKQLLKLQQKLWKFIFMKENINVNKILYELKIENKNYSLQTINCIITKYHQMKQCYRYFGKQCYNLCLSLLNDQNETKQKLSSKFESNVYKYCFKDRIVVNLIERTIAIDQLNKIVYNLTFDILEESKNNPKRSTELEGIFRPKIQKIFNEILPYIERIYLQFLDFCHQLQEPLLQESEPTIQLILFQIKALYKEDNVQKIQLADSKLISFSETQFKKTTKLPNLNIIQDIAVYQLKNRKSKLVWMSLKLTKDNQYSGILLSVSKNIVRVMNKFTKVNWKFTFSEQLQKVYLLNPVQCVLINFQINSTTEKIVKEKERNYSRKKKGEIISFAFTIIEEQRLFYLTEERNILYSCYIGRKQDLEINYYNEKGTKKYLTKEGEPKYDYIKTFNEDLFVMLGNKNFIDVVNPGPNGTLERRMRIKLDQAVFLGVSIFGDKFNEYLLIHNTSGSIAYLFDNLNLQNRLESHDTLAKLAGNPILDIFYQAYERFGNYKTYLIGPQVPKKKNLNLYNIGSFGEENLLNYLGQQTLQGHIIKYIETDKQLDTLLEKISKQKVYQSKHFLIQAEMRIPIQLCTLQDGNVVPLIRGRREDVNFFEKTTVAQRSKILDFAVLEEILNKQAKNKTMVISVMGAQSTGKSYLMNRIFGTRFTVASSRTTIGIWGSLIKGSEMNFLILDCEGLFAPDRTTKQQQKLIKILASLSDCTILNQNMGMNNRSLTQLMEGICNSAGKSIKNSHNLYLGELLVVVRDVRSVDIIPIVEQFKRNFKSQERTNKNIYLERLFGGNVSIIPICHFENKNFDKDIRKIGEHLLTKGKQRQRPLRMAKEILDTLKIVMVELCYDDNNDFEKNYEDYKVEKAKEEVLNIWFNGSEENKEIVEEIQSQKFIIRENLIIIEKLQQQEMRCLLTFDKYFERQFFNEKNIDTNWFNTLYKEYSAYIQKFFEDRYNSTLKKIEESIMDNLKDVSEERKIAQKNSLKTLIETQKLRLRICLQKCSQCELVCVSKYGHKSNTEFEKQNIRIKIKESEDQQKVKKLTKQEQQMKQKGLQLLETQNIKNQQQFFEIRNALLLSQEQQRNLKHINANLQNLQEKIHNLVVSLNLQQKDKLQQHLNSLSLLCNEQQISDSQNIQIVKKQLGELFCTISIENDNNTEQLNILICKIEQILKIIESQRKIKEDLVVKLKSQIQTLNSQLKQKQENKNKLVQKIEANKQKKMTAQNQIIKLETKSLQQTKDLEDQNELLVNLTEQNKKYCDIDLDKKLQFQKNLKNSTLERIKDRQKDIIIYRQNNQKISEKVELLEKVPEKIIKLRRQLSKINYHKKQQKDISEFTTCEQKLNIIKEELKIKSENPEDIINQIKKKSDLGRKKIDHLSENQQDNLEAIQTLKNKLENYRNYIEQIQMWKTIFDSKKIMDILLQEYNQQIAILNGLFSTQEMQRISFIIEFPNIFNSSSLFSIHSHQELQIIGKTEEWKNLQYSTESLNNKQQNSVSNHMPQISLRFLVQKQYSDFFKKNQVVSNVTQQDFFRKDYNIIQQNLKNKITILNQELLNIEEEDLLNKNISDTKELKTQLIQINQVEKIQTQMKQKIRKSCMDKISKITEQQYDLYFDFQSLKLYIKNQTSQLSVKQIKKCLEQQIQIQILKQKECHPLLLKIIDWNTSNFDIFIQFYYKITTGMGEEELENYLKITVNKLMKIKIEELTEQNAILIFMEPFILKSLTDNTQRKSARQQKLRQAQTKVKNIKQNLKSIEESIQNLENRINQEIKQKKQVEQKITQMKKKIQKIELSLTIYCKELKDLKIEVADLQTLNLTDQQNCSQLQKQINLLKQQIEQITKDLQKNQSLTEKFPIHISQNFNSCIERFKQQVQNNIKIKFQVREIQNDIKIRKQQILKITEHINSLQKKIGNKVLQEVQNEINRLSDQRDLILGIKEKIKALQDITERLRILKKNLQEKQECSKNLCSCLSSHKCSHFCSASCQDMPCHKVAGHIGIHLCEAPDHKCRQTCIGDNCSKKCTQILNHPQNIKHNCHQSHNCSQMCKFCNKLCAKNKLDNHEDHICDEAKCSFVCVLCKKPCSSQSHNHDDFADYVFVKQKNEETNQWESVKRKFHICDREHKCMQLCQHAGICHNGYRQKTKKWIKNGIQRQYYYFEQLEQRGVCSKNIPKGKVNHQGKCLCLTKDDHKCKMRCPDCKSLCQLKYDHPEEQKHQSIHRNQESLMYVAEDQNKVIKVGKKNDQFLFNVGDISAPYRCQQSCERKGRAHYHLLQCKGNEQCLQKKLKQGALHSNAKYHPYPDKKYDKVLCSTYWDLFNFKMPTQVQSFDLCNFACIQKHEGKLPVYCSLPAWHSLSQQRNHHEFICDESHQANTFTELQICFLIDITGSMSLYIDECKQTISKIMKLVNPKEIQLKFAIVGYRDHLMSGSAITQKLKSVCQKKRFELEAPISSLSEKFSDIEISLKIMKLQQKVQQYRTNKMTKQTLKAMLTSTEISILTYHYPFVFDIESTERFVNPFEKLFLPLKMLGNIFNPEGEKISIQSFLLKHINQSYEELLEESAQQQKNKMKLIEKIPLGNYQKAIQFLSTLVADGGGDPPQAVLDGMEQAANLNWSDKKCCHKYIFHIFDAPPHGKLYGEQIGDRFPDGCPCNKTHQQIIDKLNKIDVNYVIYPLSERINTTLQIFEEYGLKFTTRKIDKAQPLQFGNHASQLIIQQIEQNQMLINNNSVVPEF